MNILILGNGGREHSLAVFIKKSRLLKQLFIYPKHDATRDIAVQLDGSLDDFESILELIKIHSIDFVVIGPEKPLADGIGDFFDRHNIAYFGCNKKASIIETSKVFIKELCKEYNIPTADYVVFDKFIEASNYINNYESITSEAPIVIKANGLAAGKGVVIASSKSEALIAIQEFFDGKFSKAGEIIIIEKFIKGSEVSIFTLSDGRDIAFFASAGDHKKIGEGDVGLNTGGMGSYAPSYLLSPDIKNIIMKKIIEPSFKAFRDKNIIFKGVLFAGIILDSEKNPYLLEYNIRFGDPETQSILPLLQSDILQLLISCYKGNLANEKIVFYSNFVAVTVVIASKGYPLTYKKNSYIYDLSKIDLLEGELILHAGTKIIDGIVFSNGGRVLNIVVKDTSILNARKKIYNIINKIAWEDGYYRKDIAISNDVTLKK